MENMCKNCKTFFGHQDGLCSKCYKDLQSAPPADLSAPATKTSAPPSEEVKKNVNPGRCQECNKRLGPVSFPCKCSYYFCARHRLPEEHSCMFDHRAAGQQKICEENPQVIAEKFNRLT